MGKKEVGQLSIIDLIVSLLIAELVAISIEDHNSSIFFSIVPISILVFFQIFLSYISLKSNKIRQIIDGKPTIIIKDGKLNFSEMSKIRYNLDDLIMQLREQGIKSVEEVNYAILENSGKLSVFEKSTDYPLPIILDGIIDFEVLKEIKKDSKWVNKMLEANNINLSDVFYAFYTKQKTFIIKKGDLL
jgi:uncharacterized membrane protein YcaP (DUF421 family)